MHKTMQNEPIRDITISPVGLDGLLGLPRAATGIVLFAHGSGSGRFSPRNNSVATALRQVGLGTLLFDLLTAEEERDRRNVFDIELLAQRLLTATAWVRRQPETAGLASGYFGASTGAAAALVAAARDNPVAAIVSRGGRPDLAGPVLLTVSGLGEARGDWLRGEAGTARPADGDTDIRARYSSSSPPLPMGWRHAGRNGSVFGASGSSLEFSIAVWMMPRPPLTVNFDLPLVGFSARKNSVDRYQTRNITVSRNF
ncbi:MAG: hypothetical protein JO081_01510 [Alphaproteobacteria bacterium]|nr:hypothetical protein [Alphaproteobacteria bacterium]